MKIFGLVIMKEKKFEAIDTERKSWYKWYCEEEKKNNKLKNEIANLKLSNNVKDIGNRDLNC